MELQIVSKEVALLAKELGFDEIASQVYNEEEDTTTLVLDYELEDLGIECKNSLITLKSIFIVNGIGKVVCTAPEQALLTMWLRINYNYVIHPQIQIVQTGPAGSGQVERKWLHRGSIFDTYEECVEAMLKEALQHLVSIKKEKL